MSWPDLPRACSTAFQSGSAPSAGLAEASAATKTVITMIPMCFMVSMADTALPAPDSLHALLVNRRAVARRQERADNVSGGIERQRMGAALGRHGLLTLQRRRAEHLDDTRLADRHVETMQRRVEEDDIGNA